MMMISEMPRVEPIVIAIWCGNGKPTVLNDFLDPFVNELSDILQNQIVINNYRITVSIRCFICDTPARSYIKGIFLILNIHENQIKSIHTIYWQIFCRVGTIGHNSYHGCQKCMVQGVWSRAKSKMCYPRIAVTEHEREVELRTDERFRIRYQQEHHQEHSNLENLPIDMVRAFPTSDSLHLLDLGLMKRYKMRHKPIQV